MAEVIALKFTLLLREENNMRKAFTAVEAMIGVILMALLLAALYTVFSRTQYNAGEILANHTINDNLDRTIMRITDDIREANAIIKPPFIEPMAVSGQQTSSNAELQFLKYKYDFSRDPSTLPSGEVNYTVNSVTYFVEKEDPTDPNNKLWTLQRKMVPLDSSRNPIISEMTIHSILTGIEECVFYRLNLPHSSGGGNVYIKIRLARETNSNQSEKYSNEITISVKERGANLE